MYKSISIVLILTASLLTTFSVMAQGCLSMHAVLGKPTGYIDEAGIPVGLHVDFFTALQERSGLCIDIKLLPFSRASKSLQVGGHDGGILLYSADLDVQYITKLITMATVIIPREGLTLDCHDSLKEIIIGRLRGDHIYDSFEKENNLSIVELPNFERALEMLKRGRIDAILGSRSTLTTLIEKLDMVNDVNLPGQLILGQKDIWLMLSKKSENLDKAKQLKEAAQDLVDEGVLDDIYEKYIGMDNNQVN